MIKRSLAVLAILAAVGAAALVPTLAEAYNCTTSCYGSGNYRTCNTYCY